MPGVPRRIIWAPRAKQDLREVWRYYEHVASPEIADRVLRDIGRAGEKLREQALMWRARDDIMPGLRSVLVHPYVIFYRLTDAGVEIARVIHGRRNLAAAFRRRED
jgi:toxin ParE1/3/4